MSFAGRLGGRYAGSLGGQAIALAFNSFRFDGVHSLPPRQSIQNSMIQLLARLDGPQGGYLACIEGTATVLRGGGDEQGLSWLADQVAGRTPCVLIGAGDQDYHPAGDVNQAAGTIQIPVYVIVNSMRSRLARLDGDANSAASHTADPGVFVILEHVRQLLHGQKPGSVGYSVKELRVTGDRQLWSDDSLEVWEQTYTCVVSYTNNDLRDVSLYLKQLETYSRLVAKSSGVAPVVETSTTVHS